MAAIPVSPPRFLGLSAAAAAVLLIAAVTLLRLFYCAWLPMLPDETYYFQWSRHLDASYISKGPAVAYTIWAGTHLFGDNPFGVRFFAVMLSAGTAWQIFLLARRWFDDTAALIAVLFAGIVPLYAVGAVLMTIDPLSAFFWIWAANFFSAAVREERLFSWLAAGFAIGCGFLAKPLNALELVAFLLFLFLVPERRRLLAGPRFWLMNGVAIFCTGPIWWWNSRHHWAMLFQVGQRGKLHESFQFRPGLLVDFLGGQAAVISPLLFLALLAVAAVTVRALYKKGVARENEGELLLLILFLCVFLFYAVLALHLRCEPNWPAVSYLSLIVLLAGRWRQILASRFATGFIIAAFCLGWVEMVALHNTAALPLPAHRDPMSRTAGWTELAAQLDRLRSEHNADVLLADGYKEASVLSFDLPGKPFVYALPHDPPATQFDFWPPVPTGAPHRVLWMTDDTPPTAMLARFQHVELLERMEIWYRGAPLRAYRFYLGDNDPAPEP
jgi:4-amino-4-deoxy-L-arabinose transferase-like glycosyltransferase